MIILLIITVPSAYPPPLSPRSETSAPDPARERLLLMGFMGYFHLMITSAGNLATNGCLMAIPGRRYSKLTPLKQSIWLFLLLVSLLSDLPKTFFVCTRVNKFTESLTVFPFFYVTFRKRSKRLTSACSSISWISCFTCACIRSKSIATHRIDATAMGVGRTLVDIWEDVVKLGVKMRDFAYAWWQLSVTLINYSAIIGFGFLTLTPFPSPPHPSSHSTSRDLHNSSYHTKQNKTLFY